MVSFVLLAFWNTARRSYNIKITYKYVALFTFFIRLIITRVRHNRPGAGGGRGEKIADKFYEIGNYFVYF